MPTGTYATRISATPPRSATTQRLVVLAYILAAAMPPVGFALGLFVAVRYPRGTSRHGLSIIALSIVAALIWTLIISSGALTATNNNY